MSELTFAPRPRSATARPTCCMHRGDLHAALFSAVPPELIVFRKKLVGLERNGAGVTLASPMAARVVADAVIGADGVHSLVREFLLGPETPEFTGPRRPPHDVPGVAVGRLRRRHLHEMVGPRPPHRRLSRGRPAARRSTSSPACPIPRLGRGVLVDARRDGRGPPGAGRLPRRRAARAGRLSRRAQVGPLRARSATELGDGPVVLLGDACHPDDALHGAGRGQRSGGCRGPLALPCRDRRRRRSLPLLPGDPAGAYRAGPAHVAAEHLGQAGSDPFWVYGYDAWQTPLARPSTQAAG